MKCEKCKKECLETELQYGVCKECFGMELKNEVCKECKSKGRSNTIKIIVIAVIISVVINLIIEIWANDNMSNASFKVESFNMETEKNTYTYAKDTVSYSGKGTISCKDTNGDYIVLIEKINKATRETDYISTIVHNGKGEITTYDSSYSGTTEKPEYEFNIIGYRKFRTIL